MGEYIGIRIFAAVRRHPVSSEGCCISQCDTRKKEPQMTANFSVFPIAFSGVVRLQDAYRVLSRRRTPWKCGKTGRKIPDLILLVLFIIYVNQPASLLNNPVFPHFPDVRRPGGVRLAHRSLTTQENAIGKTEKFAVICGSYFRKPHYQLQHPRRTHEGSRIV